MEPSEALESMEYDIAIDCKGCGRKFPNKCFLRHLVRSKGDCKSVYGQEFIDNWKIQRKKQNNYKYKANNYKKISEMNGEYYQNNKENIQKKLQERRNEEYTQRNKKKEHERIKEVVKGFERGCRNMNLHKRKETETLLDETIEKFQNKSFFEEYNINQFQGIIEKLYRLLEEEIDSMFEKQKWLDVDWDNYEEVASLYAEFEPKVDGYGYIGYGPVTKEVLLKHKQGGCSCPGFGQGGHLVPVNGLSGDISRRWHELQLLIDITMKDYAIKIGQSHEYSFRMPLESPYLPKRYRSDTFRFFRLYTA